MVDGMTVRPAAATAGATTAGATGPTGTTGGLRERKKQATRQALQEAALRLTLERGLDRLTVEEISAAAGVSARTFFNYFPGKEQAIVGDDLFPADEQTITALMRDAGSVLDGLRNVAMTLATESVTRREQVRMRWQVAERYPALITRMFARLAEFDKVLASAVAARTGTSAEDAYPRMMAGVATTAIRVAVQRWTAGHGDQLLEDHVAEMFQALRGELPPDPRNPPDSGERRDSRDPRPRA